MRGLVQMLAPFAPFCCGGDVGDSAGAEGCGASDSMAGGGARGWARESEVEIPVQINGKLCTVVTGCGRERCRVYQGGGFGG